METVSIKQEGDSLSQLDYRARLSLAILLDQSDDWRRLCHLMNLSALEGGFATFTSPTKDLLTMYEVSMPSMHGLHAEVVTHFMLKRQLRMLTLLSRTLYRLLAGNIHAIPNSD